MKKKLAYIAPKVKTLLIELEQGIAAASATARPENSKGQVSEQWEVSDTDNRTIDW
ncbi:MULTISPECIES: hypothetical protein [Sphingobacterium]|uniref:Uncharacterized protein n=1 Tax=Sphingobacterium ginsenosidimutans TaxID=687845 RepID=A0ABP8A7N3_9SPHI|nr:MULTISPECIES: hypothetical protein [unclassified Sphingobacterium]MCS4226162.1 hypothetical protein [Sphingobacterium sp. BIGb0165]ULT25386.1 hypothetical protein KUH03_42540 [Sphingobacterium sp. E70]